MSAVEDFGMQEFSFAGSREQQGSSSHEAKDDTLSQKMQEYGQ